MDAKVVSFYRRIYTDLTVDHDEAQELNTFLQQLNPPPDKVLWLRSTAFRIAATEFLSSNNDKEKNISLLRTINFIVHAIETNCMQQNKKLLLNASSSIDDVDTVTSFYNDLFHDLSITQEENTQLYKFFQQHLTKDTIQMRALAFKIGCNCLSDDNKETNIKLLRCINAVVHAFERTCLQPKPFELHDDDNIDLNMSLSDAVQHLWDLDVNRLDPTRDYTINVQEGKKPYWKEDKAEDPLFTYVDESAFRRPTYAAFIALLDNYSTETGVSEVVSDAERAEVTRFLHAVMETQPMQFCHRYCHAQDPNKVPSDRRSFVHLLQNIWFELYRRDGHRDSSGFEHVFVGEIDTGKISGFHNWIQFYLEEKHGHVDYRGYIKPKSSHDALADEHDQLLTLQFTWKGIEKMVGSSFIGVSPEFEFALYTMCFLVGDEDNAIRLATGGAENDTFDLSIKCYKMARDKVGTSYPDIKSHFEE